MNKEFVAYLDKLTSSIKDAGTLNTVKVIKCVYEKMERLKNEDFRVYTPDALWWPTNMPKDAKYIYFNKEKDFRLGVKVYVSLDYGDRVGRITSLGDGKICKVNEKFTYVSDIKYLIIE